MPRYKTVVIDPPWPLAGVGWTKPDVDRGDRQFCTTPYNIMTTENIVNFPIEDFADEDCFFFIWCTSGRDESRVSTIHTALHMLEKWNAKFYTIITWLKNKGLAPWGPLQFVTEHIIFGYRGRFNYDKNANNSYKTFFDAPWTNHSEKPAKFYQLLRGWTPKPRIDIFARRAHEGFDGWGDEYVGDGPLQEYLE